MVATAATTTLQLRAERVQRMNERAKANLAKTPPLPLSQAPQEWSIRFHDHWKKSKLKDSGTPSTTLPLFKQLVGDHGDKFLVFESYGKKFTCEWKGGDKPVVHTAPRVFLGVTEQECRYSICQKGCH